MRLHALIVLGVLLWMPMLGLAQSVKEPIPARVSDTKPAAEETGDYFDLERKKIMRWNDHTKYITVYIADGSYLPYWNPQNPALVKAAFQEWEQAMAPRFHFIYMPDERGADVKVTWASRLGHDQAGETAGVNKSATWGKFIARNDVELALLHDNDRPYPPTAIQSTALHEIGHMLGLKAHSDKPTDVMYAVETPTAWSEVHHLTARDVTTLRKVYESHPDYTNPEGYHLSNFDAFKKTQKGHHMTLMWIPIPGVPFPVPIILPF